MSRTCSGGHKRDLVHLSPTEGDGMRERTFESSTSQSSFSSYYYNPDGSLAAEGSTVYDSESRYRAMKDVVTPNFHARKRAGDVICSPKLLLDYTMVETPTRLYSEGCSTSEGDARRVSGFTMNEDLRLPRIFDQVAGYMSLHASDDDTAVAQAWANVSVSEAQALASIGELPETVRWMVSLIQRMLRIIRFFKSKRKRLRKLSRKQLANAVADLWMEFRYAVRPLIFDMKQAVEAARATIKRGSRQTARGWGSSNSSSITVLDENNTSDSVCNTVLRRTETISVNYRAGVLYDIENDINGILALWGFDQNFETIWELTPMSFVVDWFFNVGDIIAAWSYNPNLRPLASWLTKELVATSTLDCAELINLNNHCIVDATPPSFLQAGTRTEKSLISERLPNPGRPILPSIDLNLDTFKLVDLAAIGRNMFRSLR